LDRRQLKKKAQRRWNLRPDRSRLQIREKSGDNGDRPRQRKLNRRRNIDASEVATCRQFCSHLTARMTGTGDKSGYMSPVLSPIRDDSNILLEVLRLGSGEPRSTVPRISITRTTTDLDRSRIRSAHPGMALSATRHDRRLYRGACTNDATTAQQRRINGATWRRRPHHPHPKPPGLGVGV
jgi:hypothetical protein